MLQLIFLSYLLYLSSSSCQVYIHQIFRVCDNEYLEQVRPEKFSLANCKKILCREISVKVSQLHQLVFSFDEIMSESSIWKKNSLRHLMYWIEWKESDREMKY